MKSKQNIISASVLLWLGFVLAISFLEAWLKFQAPGITLSLGLGIGKLVFAALNKVEWFFAIVIASTLLIQHGQIKTKYLFYLAVPIAILLLDTFYLLPLLDARAELIILGGIPTPSSLHYYYVGGELLKVSFLGIAAYQSLRGYDAIIAISETNHSFLKTKLS